MADLMKRLWRRFMADWHTGEGWAALHHRDHRWAEYHFAKAEQYRSHP